MGLFDKLWPKSENKLTLSFPEEELEKSVKPAHPNPLLEGQVEKSKIVLDIESTRSTTDNVYIKTGRLSDRELRGVASYDSIVSLIIGTRSNQASSFGRRSRSKYNRGFLIRELTPVQDDLAIPPEKKAEECEFRTRLSDAISKWVSSCGSSRKDVVEYAFKGSDSFFKECTLSEFLSAQTRNLLTFGRMATQIMRNKEGIPILWRPIPVETLYKVIGDRCVSMSGSDRDTDPQAALDASEWSKLKEEERPIAYVQRINGKNVSFFTEDEIQVKYFQKQAFEGLNGYPLAPIELAYFSILMNFYAQNYMQNSFTKGIGSKGIINLKTTEGDYLSKEDVENFRKLFSNYVARNDNSATVPVIAGAVEVEWIPLMATAKDAEFVNLFNRVVLIVCSSFQISPHEIGFGALDPEKAAIADGMKQDQIVQGEERGLRQIIETILNAVEEIAEQTFPQSKGLFVLEPVGIGQNTKEGDLAIYKEELQTSGTFGKIWSDSERTEAFPFGGHVPTSPLFHQNVARYMKYGEMRYHFFHETNALSNPAYDFIIDPALDTTYQQLKLKMPEIQQQQALMQIKGQEQELEANNMQMQMAMSSQQGQQQEQQPNQAEETQKAEDLMMQKDAHKQKLEMEKEKHQQKMDHEKEKHELNLRIALSEAQTKAKEASMSGIKNVIETVKGN